MLPVLILDPDESNRSILVEGLQTLEDHGFPATRIGISTDSPDVMQRAVESESGIALSIFGIPSGQVRKYTDLGNLVMRRNRFSYTLFCLHNPGDLNELLEHCMRPAGILTTPLNDNSLLNSLTRILEDYQSLTGETASDDCMVIEANSTAYRIPYDDILYLEALDKLLTIHTRRQEITVRRALSVIESTLPENFARCHRAYILNMRYIDQIDYSAMTLKLVSGDLLPISRGQRAEFRKRFEAQKGAAE